MVKIAPVMIVLVKKCNIINSIVVMESWTKHQRFLSRENVCVITICYRHIVVVGVVVVVVGVVVVVVGVVVLVMGVVVVVVDVVFVVVGVVENRPLYQWRQQY